MVVGCFYGAQAARRGRWLVDIFGPMRPECLESESSTKVQAHASYLCLGTHGRLRNPPVEHYDIACTQDFQFLVQFRKTHHRFNAASASHFGTQ